MDFLLYVCPLGGALLCLYVNPCSSAILANCHQAVCRHVGLLCHTLWQTNVI